MTSPSIVLGVSRLARAFVENRAPALGLTPVVVRPVHRAFRPMVEESAYDVSELAIVTAIQAIEAERPLVLLPITVAARFQHACIVQNTRNGMLTPADLVGKRVAVRSFSQTTGAWVRSILEAEYGVNPEAVTWLTQEAPHVAGAPEPKNVLRDPDGADPFDLLRDGKVAAAIFGNDMPKEDWIAPVIENPENAALSRFATDGVVHINHIVAVTRDLADRNPSLIRNIYTSFAELRAELPEDEQKLLPMGHDAMRVSVERLLGSVHRQGLSRRLLTFDDLFGPARDLLKLDQPVESDRPIVS